MCLLHAKIQLSLLAEVSYVCVGTYLQAAEVHGTYFHYQEYATEVEDILVTKYMHLYW